MIQEGGSRRRLTPRLNSETFASGLLIFTRGTAIGAKFFLSIFITRYIGLESLGSYGLVAGVVSLVPLVLSGGISAALFRDCVTEPFETIVGSLCNYWAIVLSIYFAALLAAGELYNNGINIAVIVPTLYVTLLEHLNQDIYLILVAGKRQVVLANILFFVRSAAWILIYMPAAYALPALREVHFVIWFWIAGSFISLSIFAVAARNWPWLAGMRTKGRRRWLLAKLKTSRFLYVSDLSFAFTQYLDRYVITALLGLEQVGVYIFFWQIGNAMFGIVQSVVQVHTPILIECLAENSLSKYSSSYRRLLRIGLMYSILLACVLGMVVFILLPIFKTQSLYRYDGLIIIFGIIVCIRIRALVQINALFSLRRDSLMASLNILIICVSILGMFAAYLVGNNLYVYAIFSAAPYVIIILISRYYIRLIFNTWYQKTA
jgi:O-antigen/teichoic acid export membrane protein